MGKLDPQTQAFIDEWKQAGARSLHDRPVEEVRQGIAETIRQCSRSQAEVERVEDRTVDGPNGPVPVRLYWPEESTAGPVPGVAFFHGGGFYLGSVETHDRVCRNLCKDSGALVMSVDYRLAPEHKYPAGLEDCYSAFKWLAEHRNELGVNDRPIGLAGDSAGGTLSFQVWYLSRERGGPEIGGIVAVYPALELGEGSAYGSRREFAKGQYFIGEEDLLHIAALYLDDPVDVSKPTVSPARIADFEGFPPTLLLLAEFDPCRDECLAFAERAKAAGAAIEVEIFKGTIHPFFLFDGVMDAGKRGQDVAAKWVKDIL